MSLEKRRPDYHSFSYLDPGVDYRPFELADQTHRVEPWLLALDVAQEALVESILRDRIMISLHDHVGVSGDAVDPDLIAVAEGPEA